jgi:hypothetical protein
VSRKGIWTFRIVCSGRGAVTLSDSEKTIIRTGTCDDTSIIGAGLPSGWRPARVTVTVQPGTVWHLGAWVQ